MPEPRVPSPQVHSYCVIPLSSVELLPLNEQVVFTHRATKLAVGGASRVGAGAGGGGGGGGNWLPPPLNTRSSKFGVPLGTLTTTPCVAPAVIAWATVAGEAPGFDCRYIAATPAANA